VLFLLFIGPVNNHGADSSVSDSEGHDNYVYKWPWMDQHSYNMSASGIEGELDVMSSHISPICILKSD